MNYLQRSFQISFALHAIAVLLLIFMGDRFISSEKILVIDFTLEDTAGAGNTRDRATVKTQKQERNAQQTKMNKEASDVAEPPAQTVPEAVKPVTIMSREIQMPVSSRREATAISAIGEQDSNDSGITPVSSAPHAAVDMNAVPGQGFDHSVDAGRNKYLKANLSYINDLVNRHITYPKTAWKMGLQGRVEISFFISSDGYPKRIKIMKSSGSGSLDRNAVEAVKSASPFPKPPVEAKIIIPVLYQLH